MSNTNKIDETQAKLSNGWSTKYLFDKIKRTQTGFNEALNRFKAENDEFKKHNYSKMNNLFENSTQSLEKDVKELFRKQNSYPDMSCQSLEKKLDVNELVKPYGQKGLKKNYSFLNDESSEDDEEFSSIKYPRSRYSFTDGKILKAKTVSFDENLCRSCIDEDEESQNWQNNDVKIKYFLKRQPVRSILKKPSTFSEFIDICDQNSIEDVGDERSENSGFFVNILPLKSENIMKRAKNLFEPAAKFF